MMISYVALGRPSPDNYATMRRTGLQGRKELLAAKGDALGMSQQLTPPITARRSRLID